MAMSKKHREECPKCTNNTFYKYTGIGYTTLECVQCGYEIDIEDPLYEG